jgi:hypothetical protein
MTHDAQCQFFERSLSVHILLPIWIVGQEFFYQIVVQQVDKNYEIFGIHQISF